MNSASHWEHIYGKRPPEEQGWYAQTLQPSLDWIVQSATSTEARILDAGGGASTLIDHLLAAARDFDLRVYQAPSSGDLVAAAPRLGEGLRARA